MPLTHTGCATVALGVVLTMLELTVPPTVGVDAAGARRTGDEGSAQASRRAPSPAQAALRARWRAGATLP